MKASNSEKCLQCFALCFWLEVSKFQWVPQGVASTQFGDAVNVVSPVGMVF